MLYASSSSSYIKSLALAHMSFTQDLDGIEITLYSYVSNMIQNKAHIYIKKLLFHSFLNSFSEGLINTLVSKN